MCGFAGVVAWDDRFHVTSSQLEAMSGRIAHRGPDGAGLRLNHERQATPLLPQCGLVHRRLAILDLDHRADQPFTDERGRWIAFNGEIYNFRQLRDELTALQPEYAWRTTGDTEVLLAAYAVWGEACVERLDGMFAFAIWEEQTGKLFLARDRMGQKPLYVAFVEGGADQSRGATPKGGNVSAVAFASELPALWPLGWVNRSVANDALVEYLQWGYVPSPLTIYEGAWRLKPGQAMTVMHGGVRQRSYFDPNRRTGRVTDAVTQTRHLFTEAVRRQLVSDVPVGCFLSGGVDSSIVASVMTKIPGEVRTFSIGFEDPRYDESAYAERVARHLGTKHHAFTVRPDAAADLPKIAAAFGEPFGDSSALPTYYLARETRQHVKVCLSGDGGDELFGGYDRYRAMAIGKRLRAMVTPYAWNVLSPLVGVLPGTHPKSRLARTKRLLGALHLPANRRYARYLRLFDDASLHRLLRPAVRDYFWLEWDRIATHYEVALSDRGVLEAAVAVDKLYYLPDDLLAKVDRTSMQFALEVRSPFMDPALLVTSANFSASQLRRKTLLRQAFGGDLPAEVFDRPKMGFAVPIGEWFRGQMRDMLRGTLLSGGTFVSGVLETDVIRQMIEDHEGERGDHSQRLYALLMLELWHRASGGAERETGRNGGEVVMDGAGRATDE